MAGSGYLRPDIKVMIGNRVEAKFRYTQQDGEPAPRWGETYYRSAARFGHERTLIDLWGAQRRISLEAGNAELERQREEANREAAGNRYPSHLREMVGSKPIREVDLSEWDGIPWDQIPGYRRIYDFPGGVSISSDDLFAMLDKLTVAGMREIQLDTLARWHSR